MTGNRQDDVQYSVAVVPLRIDQGRVNDPSAASCCQQTVAGGSEGTWGGGRGGLAMQAKTRKKTKISETASV
jgi:hypothetical protein